MTDTTMAEAPIIKLTAEQMRCILRLQSAYGCPIEDTYLQVIHANLQDAIDSADLNAIQALSNILRECIEYKMKPTVRKTGEIMALH